jgi:hypothetical protein
MGTCTCISESTQAATNKTGRKFGLRGGGGGAGHQEAHGTPLHYPLPCQLPANALQKAAGNFRPDNIHLDNMHLDNMRLDNKRRRQGQVHTCRP